MVQILRFMKVIVAVIIFNRINNLKRWIHCWKQCDTTDAELVIIHNDNGESAKFKAICDRDHVRYVRRSNVGMDIGAMQDVFKERLQCFPNDWDYIIWCCDDTWPMSKSFIGQMLNKVEQEGAGLSCMQISRSNPGGVIHVRTSGVCMSKEVAKHLTFPVDPVRTKSDCYHFEHKGGRNTLCEQVRHMGLSCEQVAPNAASPLWDSGYWKRLDRLNEHYEVFGGNTLVNDKIVFICPIYNSYPQIISSLICQTHKNWELILIHDGPSKNGTKSYIGNDPRVKYIEWHEHLGSWGHWYRQWALEELRRGELSDASYVVITNADNYLAPVYCERMLRGFAKSHTAVATYCAGMVHSYKSWDMISVKLQKGYVDCSGVMVKREVACEVGWRDIEGHSSDWTYFSDIAAKYSLRNFIQVRGCLLVHN